MLVILCSSMLHGLKLSQFGIHWHLQIVKGVASSTSFYLILVVGFAVEIRKKSSSRV
jgi:hypothetical protein